jgi:hypothetical protein
MRVIGGDIRAEALGPAGDDAMAMYVQLLSADRSHRSAEGSLANDVQYDCALIRLCAATGIETTAACFEQPRVERARLERALATTGMDLG